MCSYFQNVTATKLQIFLKINKNCAVFLQICKKIWQFGKK